MKLCHNCGQPLAEPIRNCPTCGTEVGEGLKKVDDYNILEVVHKGHGSMVCRAVREGEETPVALRLFTSGSGFDQTIARRFQDEFEKLQRLPEEWFVRHYAIGRSSEGMWYRVSEWLEAESWGDLMSSGRLQDLDVVYDLFHRLAAILDGLHKSGHFIPHLILNDILILKGGPGRVDVKIDYKLSRILDPNMTQPVQMLQNLLQCHPDIKANRPLDFKSDVWSLGRIFAQVLAADIGLKDPSEIMKNGRFPKEISILIRSMLADAPELRPRMSEVAEALIRIRDEMENGERGSQTQTAGEIRKLKRAVGLIAAMASVAVVVFFFWQYNRYRQDDMVSLGEYAERYAASVAFVVVEYEVQARLMRALIDWNAGKADHSDQLEYLSELDWRSPGEFFGYLARVVQAAAYREQTLNAWNSPAEKGWLAYITGLIRLSLGDSGRSLDHFRDAALASGRNEWLQLLSLSMLDHLLKGRRDAQADLSSLREELLQAEKNRYELATQLAPLIARYEQAGDDPPTRIEVLLKVSPMEPENRKLAVFAAFYAAITSQWSLALEHAQWFLEGAGREDALRLGAGLLIPVVLEHLDKKEKARQRLVAFSNGVLSPWHRQIAETLLGTRTEEELLKSAGNEQEKILTAAALLGFHAEANGDLTKAAGYYREALGTYLDNWLEYELARQRYILLRRGAQP